MRLWEKLAGLFQPPSSSSRSEPPAPAQCPKPRAGRRRAAAARAVVEAIESRIMLTSTFHVYMSAQQTGSHSSNYAVTLWSTGQKASSYVVYYNDPNSGGSTSVSYTAPSDGSPLTVHYQYKGAYTGTVYATGTSTSNATATAYFALSSSFGNFQGVQGTGAATRTPNGNAGGVGQTSEVLDNLNNTNDPMNGDIFVAHSYYASSTSQAQIAVTAFTSGGQFVSSWGSINNNTNNGTLVVPYFGGGTTPYDIPSSIAVGTATNGDTYLAVAGKCATGWAICYIDTAQNPSFQGTTCYGYARFESSANFEAGQANAIEFDNTETGSNIHVVAAGTDGTHMVAIALDTSGNLFSGTNKWTNGVVTVSLGTHDTSAGANAVIEEDEGNTYGGQEVLVGGYTNWQNGSSSGRDMTIASINDDTGSLDATKRVNIGQTLASLSCGPCPVCSPSLDSVYSLMMWQDSSSHVYVDAVAASNALTNQIVVAQFNISSADDTVGSLNSSFGQWGDGIGTGAATNGSFNAGSLSAVITNTTTGAFVVVGTSSDTASQIISAGFTGGGVQSYAFGNYNHTSTGGTFYQDLGDTASNATSIGYGVILNSDGTVLVCGNTTPSGSSNSQIALLDYLVSNQVTIS